MCSANEAVKLIFATHLKYFSGSRSMIFARSKMSTVASEVNLRKIFRAGVDSVLPKTIFGREHFQIVVDDARHEQVRCKFNDINVLIDIAGGNKHCHLVGFGKGVFGMAEAICNVLGDRLKSGILSVPFGTVRKFQNIKLCNVTVCEGARNNLPDESAAATAKNIVEFVGGLNETDVLFVLITGGGSALLPLPCDGVTLAEKCAIVKQLASKGADINDINRVRIDLSKTKGGKLAANAKRTGSVISFIISDIIDDPIHLIASGPTVISDGDATTSKMVLERYALWDSLPVHIQNAITTNSVARLPPQANIANVIIANNKTAVQAAIGQAKEQNIPAIALSTRVDGTVAVVSKAYIELAEAVNRLRRKLIGTSEFLASVRPLETILHTSPSLAEELLEVVLASGVGGFCLIAGGEPTVEITGNGTGGRNQELALRFSQCCYTNELLHGVQLLSAGTDGIDGMS